MAVQRNKKSASKAGPKSAPSKKTPPAPRGDEEAGGGESEANVFDQTKAQGTIDGGKYVAIIGEAILQPKDDKGRSCRFQYEIATDGEFRGQKVTQFYKMFEADGSAGKGLAFLKKDLAVLGYSDIKFGDVEQVFEEIVEKNIGCNVTVKQNGQFTNVYLNGLSEDSEVVEDYLANRPF